MGSALPKDAVFITLAAAVGIGAVVAYTTVTGGTAETPEVLRQVDGLTDAMTLASEMDRPVVAFVTADWCPPCQQMKRTTLKDERVTEWLSSNVVAVSLVDGANNEDISRLPVQAFPTTFVIRDGEIAGQLSGYVDSERYLRFLAGAVEAGDSGAIDG